MKASFYFMLFLAAVAVVSSTAQAQVPLVQPQTLPHYKVAVGLNTTTVLVFPANVKPVDRGTRDILAQKQPGVENVLKLKAAHRNFLITNLHVFTADGKIYAFDVRYTDSLGCTYDFTHTAPSTLEPIAGPRATLSDEPLNSTAIEQYVQRINSQRPDRREPVDRAAQMSIRLQKVALGGPLLFFRYRITNRSELDYPLDFLRMYVRDRKKATRTSVQDKELMATYEDSATTIAGGTHLNYVVAVPAFTLAGGKELVVEAYEKNGGRSLRLRVQNKTLLAARKM